MPEGGSPLIWGAALLAVLLGVVVALSFCDEPVDQDQPQPTLGPPAITP